MKPRIALIGFDGMDAALVRRWAVAGHLPAFARLFETSAWTQFELPPEYSSGMVWPSINTGLAPAGHQAYFGTRLVEGTYTLRPRHHSDLRGIPFWRELAAHGRQPVLMDVPFSGVNAACGGAQIVGWGQHEWGGRRESHPPHLLAQVEQEFGRHPIAPSVEDAWARGGPGKFLHALLQGIERRTQILHHLAGANEWEFFYGVYHEAHSAGHYLWHLSDTTHPRFDASVQTRHGDALLQVYSALDRSLSGLVELFENDSALMIILSHGMGPNYNGDHLFAELLARFNRSRGGSAPSVGSASTLHLVWESTIGSLPPRIRHEAQRYFPPNVRRWLSTKRRQHPALWRGEPAFALPGLDGFSAVRVNLLGREPAGVVRPGEDYDAYLDALQTEIESWTVGHTGCRAVARMHRAARGAESLRLGVAPDLMVWWDKEAGLIEEIHTRSLGTVQGKSADERTGEHIMHSLVLLRHPGIAAGPAALSGMGICDIASTLSELAGVSQISR